MRKKGGRGGRGRDIRKAEGRERKSVKHRIVNCAKASLASLREGGYIESFLIPISASF